MLQSKQHELWSPCEHFWKARFVPQFGIWGETNPIVNCFDDRFAENLINFRNVKKSSDCKVLNIKAFTEAVLCQNLGTVEAIFFNSIDWLSPTCCLHWKLKHNQWWPNWSRIDHYFITGDRTFHQRVHQFRSLLVSRSECLKWNLNMTTVTLHSD